MKRLYILPALLQAIYKKMPEGTGIIDTVKAALSNRLCVVSLGLVNRLIVDIAANIYVSGNIYNQAKLTRPRLTTHSLLLKAAFTVSTMPVLSGSFL